MNGEIAEPHQGGGKSRGCLELQLPRSERIEREDRLLLTKNASVTIAANGPRLHRGKSPGVRVPPDAPNFVTLILISNEKTNKT